MRANASLSKLGMSIALRAGAWALLCVLTFLSPGFSLAQQSTNSFAQDQLMQLMLAQPRIETTGPVRVSAAFDPPIIGLGQQSTYRVTFNAMEDSIDWPDQLKATGKVELRPGGHGQVLQMAGPVMEPRTSFLVHATPTAAGEVLVPEFTLKVYDRPVTVPAARLWVLPTTPPNTVTSSGLLLDAPTNSPLFVGQSGRVRILLPSSGGGVQILMQVQLVGQGFIADQSLARQSIEPLPGAANKTTYVYELSFTPITAGALHLFAQGWTPASRSAQPSPEYTLLDSPLATVEVRPLPDEGRLPGFSGAVGVFMTDPLRLSTNILRVGQPVELSVTFRGQGNLARLIPPAAPTSKEWQVFGPQTDNVAPAVIHAQGAVTFHYTLVPLTHHATATPAFPFSYFNPQKAAYIDLTLPSLPVSVEPGTGPESLQLLLAARRAESKKQREPVLSPIARSEGHLATTFTPLQMRPWFAWAQLVPAVLFAGLWVWDRRRRFLIKHPELVFKRRARRALRREWSRACKAAARRDAPAFAAAALNAIRHGSAPYYPAAPRSLVGSDVLALFPKQRAAGGPAQAVSRLFQLADAANFANTKPDLNSVLALEPQLAEAIETLDSQLNGEPAERQ